MKNLFPLITFFSLAYLISWLIWLPLYGPCFGIRNLPVLPYHHALGGLGPLLAAIITAGLFYKKAGIKELLKGCAKIKPIFLLLVALLSPFTLLLLAIGTSSLIDNNPLSLKGIFTTKEFPQFNPVEFFLYNFFFFGFGEETGWRGFALPRIQTKFNALTSSIIITLLWALWHWPLFFYRPGYINMEAGGIIGWVFSLLTGSVLLNWMYNSSRGSILICAIFHSTIDIAFTSDLSNQNVVNYLGALITVWGILTAIFLTVARRR